jgi:hypothetical protein
MIRRKAPWDARSTISRSAHVLERIGLALTGASCGLFVAAHVGRADIELISSATAVLSAVGTFLAAVAAVVSVSSIVMDETPKASSALLICLAWAVGATLQIAAGIIARKHANAANQS